MATRTAARLKTPPAKTATRDESSAVARALAMLAHVARADGPVTLAALSEALRLPKASAHRIASHLERNGMLLREPRGRRYSIGQQFVSMAVSTLTHSAARGARRAILQALVDEIGETCNITMMDGANVIYVDRVEAHWPLRLNLQQGSRVPLHCTASGKLFLAHLRASARKRLIGALELERHTPNTITERAKLERELARIRAEKVGTDNEEFLAGLVAVAVPVLGPNKEICAALAVHGPTARLPLGLALTHVPKLRVAAKRLSAAMFDRH
jgi:IclR family transcriptional regulator, acetate operon repressor